MTVSCENKVKLWPRTQMDISSSPMDQMKLDVKIMVDLFHASLILSDWGEREKTTRNTHQFHVRGTSIKIDGITIYTMMDFDTYICSSYTDRREKRNRERQEETRKKNNCLIHMPNNWSEINTRQKTCSAICIVVVSHFISGNLHWHLTHVTIVSRWYPIFISHHFRIGQMLNEEAITVDKPQRPTTMKHHVLMSA